MVKRIAWVFAGVLLAVSLTLAAGRSRHTLTIVYEGVCGTQEGVCVRDLGTGRELFHSPLLGASWKRDLSQATTSNQGRVLVQAPTGETLKKLTSTTMYFAAPQWAPDDEHVLFEAASKNRINPDYSLWMAHAVTEDMRPLTDIRMPSFAARLVWSPDLTRFIYFGAPQEFGFVEMSLCDVIRSACQPLPLAAHGSASWLADSSQFVYTPGGNRLQWLDGADYSPAGAVRVFQEYYDHLLDSTRHATIYYNLIEFPLLTEAGVLFTHSHERRVYHIGADGTPVRVSDETFDTPELYPITGRDDIVLLLDQYHTFNTDRIEFLTLNPATHEIKPYGEAQAWRFIGVLGW